MNPINDYPTWAARPEGTAKPVHCAKCDVVCSHAFVHVGNEQLCYQCWQNRALLGTSASLGKHDGASVIKPEHFLQSALKALVDRGVQRDTEDGERSMALAVSIFNAWVGKDLSESDGWRFMIALKQARSVQGGFTEDDYTDLAGYAALLGECEAEKREMK